MEAERSPSGGRLVIVGGPPASGKSTLARSLEASLRAVRLEPDAWLAALALPLTADDARDRVERLQWRLAAELLEQGVTVVLDWGAFTRAKRDALRTGARERGAAVELHFLQAPREVLWTRIGRRGTAAGGPSAAAFARMLEELEPPTAEELAGFDAPADWPPETG